eukprot:m.87907 g.87907  ORF g.87907 m.87907 type:complete len:56 (-) comp12844_c0_seq2:51-218(-)
MAFNRARCAQNTLLSKQAPFHFQLAYITCFMWFPRVSFELMPINPESLARAQSFR